MSAHTRKTMLLATNQQQSVLNTLDGNGRRSIAYTPYGHRPRENGLLSLLGFNGEPPDALTGHYHLGNGYRQFNPVLMRFNSPDSWSPFGDGGLNAYAYCAGEPVLQSDRTGHSIFSSLIKGFKNMFLGRTPSRLRTKKNVAKQTSVAQSTAYTLEPGADYNKLTSAELKLNTGLISNRFNLTPGPQNRVVNTHLPKLDNDVKAPNKTVQDPSKITRDHLLNRRTRSLGHAPENFSVDLESFYLSKQFEPDGGFLTTQFASSPTGTHAKLYAAMDSELRSHPTAQIQRTIRTGGRK